MATSTSQDEWMTVTPPSDPEPDPLDRYMSLHRTVVTSGVEDAAELLAELADQAPDREHLLDLSMLVESYVFRGEEAYPHLEAAMRRSSNLRRAWSCVFTTVPEEWNERLDALVQPDEHLER